MFSTLTEEEQAEAKRFGELITNLWYEELEKFKKENSWRSKLLLNWCRISKNFPELHKKRQEFIEIDVALKQAEYENKINSGNPIAVAEVIRDLHRSENLAEQSYSERQIYEQAVERLASEVAVYDNISLEDASKKLLETVSSRNL